MAEQSGTQPGVTLTQMPTAQFRVQQPSFEDVPAVYGNFAQATVALHDLTLFFGWFATPPVTEVPPDPIEVNVRPVAAVTIPLGVVPALIQVLSAQVAAWEHAHGQKLPLPAQVAQPPADEGSKE